MSLRKLKALQDCLGVPLSTPLILRGVTIDRSWTGKKWEELHTHEEDAPSLNWGGLLRNLADYGDIHNREPSHERIITNQKLALVGDGLLLGLVRLILYKKLTPLRASTLADLSESFQRNSHLTAAGQRMGIAQYILCCPDPIVEAHGQEKYIADALEALIATIFIDQGGTVTESFVQKHIVNPFSYIYERR